MELRGAYSDVARVDEREEVHDGGVAVKVASEHLRSVAAGCFRHRVELLPVVAVVDLVPRDPVVRVGATLGGHASDSVAG